MKTFRVTSLIIFWLLYQCFELAAFQIISDTNEHTKSGTDK